MDTKCHDNPPVPLPIHFLIFFEQKDSNKSDFPFKAKSLKDEKFDVNGKYYKNDSNPIKSIRKAIQKT